MTSGRRVVVTAGAAGIGLAIAKVFHAGGDSVSVCDVDDIALEKAEALGLDVSKMDVANSAGVDAWVARLGAVDVLINNAGIAGPAANLEDTDPLDWARCFDINVHGAFNMIRAAAPSMRAAGRGVIVNISTASTLTGLPRRTAYIASKWALEGLTRNLAREFGPHGIRINALRPGFMDTERMVGIMNRIAQEQGRSVQEVEADALRFISMRSKVHPSEIGEMAWFLASEGARHVTGQIIGVDGNAEWEG